MDRKPLSLLLCLCFFSGIAAAREELPPSFLPEFGAFQEKNSGSPEIFSGAVQSRDTVRVLIFPHLGPYSLPQGRETKFDEVTFRSQDDCVLYSDSAKTREIAQGRTFTFHHADVALKGVYLRCDARTTLVREKGLISYDYQGTFYIRGRRESSGAKSVHVVQILPFETYLKGVVPAEMPSTWPEEALKAQAIAARSYALYQLNVELSEIAARDYDLDDTIFYQAYLGLSWMRSSTNKAVEDTSGQTLQLHSQPIQAFFSADSGGFTELGENVWEMRCGFCVSKPEVYDLSLVPSAWSVTYSLSDIEKRIRGGGWYTGAAPLKSFRVLPAKINQSGRVMEVELRFADGKILNLFGPTFQRALRMRSNLFTIREIAGDNAPNQFQFDGRGFGHGVGMNQWGARVLAQNYGWDHRRILFFYYDKVDIR